MKLGDNQYQIVQSKLKDWLNLEEIKGKALKAESKEEFVNGIFLYISTALSVPINSLIDLPWFEIADVFIEINLANTPKDFPLFNSQADKEQNKEPWEYEGRSWYFWLHKLAKNYNWEVEYIANLSIDDAIALIQEILVQEQLDKEWQYSLTEIAYSYDERSKKSRFVPLVRPDWMRKEISLPKPVKLLRSMLPMGNVVHLNKPKDETT